MQLQTSKHIAQMIQAGIQLFFSGNAERDTAQELGCMKATELVFPLLRPLSQNLLRHLLEFLFDTVDFSHHRPQTLDGALVFGSDDFFDDPVKHDAKIA
jgi:hypothetical protein